MWADAVFEGGGVKAIGLIGALTVAERRGYRWKKLAGTSAGAIIATLLAAGYRADELRKIETLDYMQFLGSNWWHRIPFIGPAARVWFKKGLYSGARLERWMEEWLRPKGIHTFADLEHERLQIVASDITRGRLLVLPRDLELYGLSPHELSVARAVRMSCSIPFFFDPMIIESSAKPNKNVIVDGGVLSNFPVWLFDKEEPRWPTFGFRLISETTGNPHEISGPISLFVALFQTMLEAHDTRHVEEEKDKVRTIFVPSIGVKSTDFHISPERSAALFESGVKAAERFFRDWDFPQYVQSYRGQSAVVINIKKD